MITYFVLWAVFVPGVPLEAGRYDSMNKCMIAAELLYNGYQVYDGKTWARTDTRLYCAIHTKVGKGD